VIVVVQDACMHTSALTASPFHMASSLPTDDLCFRWEGRFCFGVSQQFKCETRHIKIRIGWRRQIEHTLWFSPPLWWLQSALDTEQERDTNRQRGSAKARQRADWWDASTRRLHL